MSREFKPSLLLLGCGYTLTRFLQCSPASRIVFTTRSDESLKVAADLVGSRYEGMVVDLKSPSSIRDVFERYPTIDTVVDSIPPFFGKDDADPIAGVKNVCEVMKDKKIKRFVYLSTTGVFGVNDGSEVTEQSECRPQSARAKARLDSEQEYARAFSNFTALRIAAIYGPGRGLGTSLKNGTYHPIAGKDRISNRTHVDDLVEAIQKLLVYRGIPPKVLCVADDYPAPISEVVKFYCAQFNLKPPVEISEGEALNLEMYTQLSNQRVSNKLLKSELQMKLKYPSYKEGAGTEFL